MTINSFFMGVLSRARSDDGRGRGIQNPKRPALASLRSRRVGWLAVALLSPPMAAAEPAGPVTVSQFQMGMMTHLTVWTDAPDAAREACRLAFLEMLRLNNVFSDYDPESELSRLCARAGQGGIAGNVRPRQRWLLVSRFCVAP